MIGMLATAMWDLFKVLPATEHSQVWHMLLHISESKARWGSVRNFWMFSFERQPCVCYAYVIVGWEEGWNHVRVLFALCSFIGKLKRMINSRSQPEANLMVVHNITRWGT